jgi:CheY-like chemotaxis protein/DNA-directed RNA polymerase subunit RPC12/RpoP
MARIIIADDNQVSLLMLKKLLEVFDHDLVFCQDGQAAVDAFIQERADLVLLDVNMPVMDGIAACQAIRRLAGGGSVPIVMISALDDEGDVEKGLSAGANDYLLKPIKESHLLAKLKVFLRMATLHQSDFDLAKNRVVLAGRYRVVKLLGYGTHAIVFQAEDTAADNRRVALKLFRDTPNVGEIYDAFVGTVERLRPVDSTHVLHIQDYGQAEGRLYVVMEHADGGDLSRCLKLGPMAQRDAVRVGLDVAKAIQAIARAGVVHFDIKPENILLRGADYVLGDFGIVATRTSATMPLKAEVWGTMAYLAPEYITRGDIVPGKSDLYSLGVTLYQALAGENPFAADRAASAMFCQVHLTPPPLSTLNPKVDAELSDLVAAMMAKAPENRPDADAVVDCLARMQARFADDGTKAVALSMPPVVHGLIAVPSAEMFSHEGGQIPSSEVRPGRQGIREGGVASDGPSLGVRLLQWTGMQVWAIRAWILAALGAVAIFAVAIALVLYFTDRPQVDEDDGTLAVLQCLGCNQVTERMIHDLADERCSACGGRLAIAYTCIACGHQFPFDENQPMKLDGSEYRCPKCGSHDTVPSATSAESSTGAASADPAAPQ